MIHRIDFNTIPDYFSQRNAVFAKHMQIILPPASSLEAFREIGLLMHKIMTTNIVHALWIVYRKSGTGELPSSVTAYRGDRRVWPMEVQSLVKEYANLSVDDHDACQQVVHRYLYDLKMQNQQWQRELRIKILTVPGYTRIIEYALERFVKQELQPLHIDIDQRIASVQYRYADEILQRAYLAENPNDKQVSMFSFLFCSDGT